MRLRGTTSAFFVLLLGLPLLGAIATGCGSCNDKNAQSDAPVTDAGKMASLSPEQASKVLAKVGDRSITLGEYVAALEHMDQFDRLRYQSPERRKELLNEMINVELLAREATAKGYDKDPLAQQELRAVLRDAMLAEARKDVPVPNDIPEAEVRAYFDAHKADYKDPERRRLSFIVLKDEAAAKDALEAAKKTTNAGQWGDLVKQKSVDPQARDNVPIDLAGDVGFVTPPGDTRGENVKIPEDARVVGFEIKKVGDVGERLAKAGGKYYVVRLSQKTDPHERQYAEAERSIRVKLAQDKIRAKENDLVDQLRKQFPVQIDDNSLASVKVDLAPPAASVDAGIDSGRK
jgi:parvulin-like peptidyl-prolyl isomerase